MNGQSYQVTFGKDRINHVRKAHNHVRHVNYGLGTIIWCGLPLELASESAATRAFYALGLNCSETVPTKSSPVLMARKALQEKHCKMAYSSWSFPSRTALNCCTWRKVSQLLSIRTEPGLCS